MLWGLLIAVIITAAWLIDVQLRPWKKCRACGGKGRLGGVLVAGTHADCRRCGRTGRVPRVGARRERS